MGLTVKRDEGEYKAVPSKTGATVRYYLNDLLVKETSVPDDVKAELQAGVDEKHPEPEREPKTGKITKGVAQETNKNGTAGRPTKYTDDLPEKMLAYFDIDDPFDTFITEETHSVAKSGATKDVVKKKMIAKKLPTFERFAHEIGVHYDTLREWATAVTNPEAEPEKQELKYPEFSEAYKRAKFLQKEFLIQNGLQGLYPAASFIFVAKNITDMVDRQTIEHQDKDLVEKRDAVDNWLDTLRDNVQSTSDDTKAS